MDPTGYTYATFCLYSCHLTHTHPRVFICPLGSNPPRKKSKFPPKNHHTVGTDLPQNCRVLGVTGNWGTLRIPREDWGTLGKIRGITTPLLRTLLQKAWGRLAPDSDWIRKTRNSKKTHTKTDPEPFLCIKYPYKSNHLVK